MSGRLYLRTDSSLGIVDASLYRQRNLKTRILTTESTDAWGSATLQHVSGQRINIAFNTDKKWIKKMSYEAGSFQRGDVHSTNGLRFMKQHMKKKECQFGEDTFEILPPDAQDRAPAFIVRRRATEV